MAYYKNIEDAPEGFANFSNQELRDWVMEQINRTGIGYEVKQRFTQENFYEIRIKGVQLEKKLGSGGTVDISENLNIMNSKDRIDHVLGQIQNTLRKYGHGCSQAMAPIFDPEYKSITIKDDDKQTTHYQTEFSIKSKAQLKLESQEELKNRGLEDISKNIANLRSASIGEKPGVGMRASM